MSRFTAAYTTFSQRLNEINTLRKIAKSKQRLNPVQNINEINTLCRSSVVLLSSHLEGYIKELGENAIDAFVSKSVNRTNLPSCFFYHISKSNIEEIRGSTEANSIADKIFSFIASDLSHWSRVGPFNTIIDIDKFNKGFSNPAYQKISSYFNRFGYKSYKHDLSCFLKNQYFPCTNMVEHLVSTRNKIAHGDLSVTQTITDLEDMMVLIKMFSVGTDKVFADWCKKNYCSIR